MVMGKCCLEVSPWALLIHVHSKSSSVGLWWSCFRCSKCIAERDTPWWFCMKYNEQGVCRSNVRWTKKQRRVGYWIGSKSSYRLKVQLDKFSVLMEQHLVIDTEWAICPKLVGHAGVRSDKSAAFRASCLKYSICKRERAFAVSLLVPAICVNNTNNKNSVKMSGTEIQHAY